MKRILLYATVLILNTPIFAQEYVTHSFLGLKNSFGTLNNPYTNGALTNFKEKARMTMLEFGVEGMEKNFYVNFKTDFFGVIPDYIVKAANKKNRKQIYGAYMSNFHDEYNKSPQQYEFNASFSDWDVMGGHISYGYKYVFLGGNFSWCNTSIDAYQSVSNIKIKKQEPANYYGFNERGNFTYGLNVVLWSNSTKLPIRLICSYDWMLMRDYKEKWRTDLGNRLTFDLQSKIQFKKDSEKKKGFYVGIIYRRHTIDYPLSVNAVELSKTFTSSITSIKLGYSWGK